MQGGDGDYHVVIRVKPAAADLVREREWHATQEIRELDDGGLVLGLRLGALAEVERRVLGRGPAAELRDKLQAAAEKLAGVYRRPLT